MKCNELPEIETGEMDLRENKQNKILRSFHCAKFF